MDAMVEEQRMTADEFRAELDRLGLSQMECSRIMGVDGRTVRRWALGERPIPPLARNFLRFYRPRKRKP